MDAFSGKLTPAPGVFSKRVDALYIVIVNGFGLGVPDRDYEMVTGL